ncbi:restriction endonuclease subunit S [Cytobacillus sp. FSL H8-0458]|uniref:restriction endonuclease subunit S n=1 Tax=Cytobacillus sp. FSL H8-0458 TaxID=2975346 RepID=UPI0030FC06FB
MGDKITKSPQIRFAGFTDAWEQRMLGEISEKVTEKNKNNIYSETLTNSAEFGIINQRDFFEKDISNEKNLNGYYVVRSDDFVYNPRISNSAPVGPIKRNKLGRTGVMSPLYYVFRTHDVDKTYLEKYFTSNYWHKFMKLNGDSGARSDRFAIKDSLFREMPIPIPSIEEQTKIGNYFEQLEDLITLHQRKLELLEDTKKSLLQKMFPKDGANVPEIRLAGFTDAWEQRKLGEITQIKTGSSDLQDAVGDGEYPFFVRSENIERSNRWIFDGEAILIPGEGRIGEIFHYINGKFDYHQRVYKISNFTDSVTDGKYILYYMQRNFKRHALKFTVKATVDSLRLPMLTEFEVVLPSLEEQRKVSAIFSHLDNLITLHQRELDSLRNLKKLLLQQMFI